MPSERELVDRFRERRAALETLRVMSAADERVVRIAPEFTRLDSNWAWPRPESLLGFSRARWERYRAIFEHVDSKRGLERSGGGAIFIIAGTSGLTFRGVERGYAYLPVPPRNSEIVSSLGSGRRGELVVRPVEPPWYIYEARDR